jgi:outer membrane immunogenic protein
MRHLIGITAAVAFGGTAMAADLAVKAPPPIGYGNWTSCYIGGNVAGGWSRTATDDFLGVTGIGTTQIDGGGLLYGGQIGCDYQFMGAWIVGVDARFDNGPIVGNNSFDFPAPLTDRGDTKFPWIVTTAARLGYATDPQTMIYAKGGAAFTKLEMGIAALTPQGTAQPLYTASENRSGWLAGLGLEHKWWPNVSGIIEWNYIGLGAKGAGFSTVPGGVPVGTLNLHSQIQTFTLGLNFRLYGGPVAAKY